MHCSYCPTARDKMPIPPSPTFKLLQVKIMAADKTPPYPSEEEHAHLKRTPFPETLLAFIHPPVTQTLSGLFTIREKHRCISWEDMMNVFLLLSHISPEVGSSGVQILYYCTQVHFSGISTLLHYLFTFLHVEHKYLYFLLLTCWTQIPVLSISHISQTGWFL